MLYYSEYFNITSWSYFTTMLFRFSEIIHYNWFLLLFVLFLFAKFPFLKKPLYLGLCLSCWGFLQMASDTWLVFVFKSEVLKRLMETPKSWLGLLIGQGSHPNFLGEDIQISWYYVFSLEPIKFFRKEFFNFLIPRILGVDREKGIISLIFLYNKSLILSLIRIGETVWLDRVEENIWANKCSLYRFSASASIFSLCASFNLKWISCSQPM